MELNKITTIFLRSFYDLFSDILRPNFLEFKTCMHDERIEPVLGYEVSLSVATHRLET